MSSIDRIAGKFGAVPTVTGAQTVSIPCRGFKCNEKTTFGTFKNYKGETVVTDYTGKTVEAGDTAWFDREITEFTITSGGLGQVYKSKIVI